MDHPSTALNAAAETAREPRPASPVSIRQLAAAESEAFHAHLLRLDPDSRHNRFGGGVSDEFLRAYADPRRHPHRLIYGFLPDGHLRGVAELQPFGSAYGKEAEAALSVESQWRGQGIGTALLERMLLGAGNRGIELVRITCLPDNDAMRKLARKFGAELRWQPGGGLAGEFRPAGLSPASWVQEMVADEFGLLGAIMDAQARAFRGLLPPQR